MKKLALALVLCAAAGAGHAQRPVKDVTAKEAISVAGRGNVAMVRFARIVNKTQANEPLGDREEGMFCQSRGRFLMTQAWSDAIRRGAGRGFLNEMTRAGYPNPFSSSGTTSAFEEKKPIETDFEVGAVVNRIQLNLCISGKEVKGGVYIEAKWELYSKAARKVVFDTVTEGSYQNTSWEVIAPHEWFERAFAVATRNLLSHKEFGDLLSAPAAAPVQVAAGAPIVLAPAPVLQGGVAQNATLLRASVVTVNSGRGTGSGFFVSAEGHVITSAHVVGDVKFVKVQIATGREVIGEVLRVDAKRDVALLKTEPIGALPLSIRSTEPNIGEELYAIGSPLGNTFSGSVTRGILSGHRTLGDLRYLQSDVGVLPGNSGGPLLDAAGKVVGVAKGGVSGGMGNLNLFVPIADAVSTLSLQVKE